MPPKIKAEKKLVSELPPVPVEYEPLKREEHEAVGLPAELCTTPLDVFKRLFVQEIWEALCENTNAYYQYKKSSLQSSGSSSIDARERPWKNTTVGELKVWVGLLLYMGLVPIPGVTRYWQHTLKQVPMSAMSQNRFTQLKRFLHVSPPHASTASASASASAEPAKTPEWWEKLEPMSSIAQRQVKECYVPGSNVAIDEMMVKSEGRSVHTLKMPNKPIDHGYKIFALAEHGYTYSWIYYSRVKGAACECKLQSRSMW